jgi:hypothetical protein
VNVRLRQSTGRISLLMKDSAGQEVVLAVLDRFWDSGTWVLQDIRLNPHVRRPSKWFGGAADDFWADFVAESEEEADLARSVLRDYKESAQPDGRTLFEWCTYRGIAIGRRASEMGSEPVNHLDAPICRSRADGLTELAKIAEFWRSWAPPQGSDLLDAVGAVKVPNLNLQPTSTQVRLEVIRKESLLERPRQ